MAYLQTCQKKPDPNPRLWALKPVVTYSVVLPPRNGEEGREEQKEWTKISEIPPKPEAVVS